MVAFFRAFAEAIAAKDVAGLFVDHAHFALDAGSFELADQRPEGKRLTAEGKHRIVELDFGEEGAIRGLLSNSFGVDVSLNPSSPRTTT